MPQRIKYPVVNGIKECGACGLFKSISEYKPARSHFSSQCISCRKQWNAAYRQRPEIKVAQIEYIRQHRKDPAIREKMNERTRRHRRKPTVKLKRNATRRVWSAREKQKAVYYKGGRCVICGYSKYLAALDFHHLDPLVKEGYGTGALKAHWSFERNKPELDKCILVCCRCHREIHSREARV